jgi:hypothetical protein
VEIRNMTKDSAEAAARTVNAQPWEPPPGMIKLQCPQCRYLFAAPIPAEPGLRCPDCAAVGARPDRSRE